MNTTPDSIPEPSSEYRSPSERLSQLGKVSPMKRYIPRTIVGWALCMLFLLLVLVLCASLASDQAAEVINVWIERITKNISQEQ